MRVFEWEDVNVEVDEDGFMQQPELWNEHIALALASTEGLSNLSESHWNIVRYIRNYYLEYNTAPMARKLASQ